MNRAPTNDIYESSLVCWRCVGEYLYSTSWKTYIFRVVNLSVLLAILLLVFVNFLHIDVEMYIDVLKYALSPIHVVIKYISFIYHKERFGKLLKARIKFWDYRKFPKTIARTVESMYNIVKNVQNWAIMFTLTLAILYFIPPVFNEDIVFTIRMWTFPNSLPLNSVLLALQYMFIIILPIVLGYDFMYTTLCIDVVTQIKLLKYNLKFVTFESRNKAVEVIRACIDHHQFLLSVLTEMREMYSLILLFQYVATMLEACAELYVFTLGGNGLGSTVTNFATMLFWFGQFAFYSFLAEMVTYEFSDISRAVYLSKWYNGDVVVKKLMLLLMAKSQQVQYFSGAGLVDINVYGYGSVARKIFSFYTILRNLLAS